MSAPSTVPSPEALHHERRWSVFGPDLVAAPPFPLFRLPATARAHVLPERPVPPHLPRRLGRRFEAHWCHALAALPGWTVLADGVQVRDGRRTVGELDLLAAGPDGVWHLELAVKFYLCTRGATGDAPRDWVGPRGHDRLDLKLERMRAHQLPMGVDPRARATVDALGLPRPDRSAAVLRGVRFADWRHPRPDAAGLWCTAEEQAAALPTARVLTRPEWLGFGPTADDAWLQGPRLARAVAAEHTRGAAQLVDPTGVRWLVLP